LHAVHHSAEELDWVAAHREHPLDGVLTALCMNLPALMLGVRVELLSGIAVFRALWSIFVHSNVRLPLGPLRFLFGAPELHHWHHARESRHNFANLAPYLDWIFGTHHHPSGEEDYALGLEEQLPGSYLGMLLAPLRSPEGGSSSLDAAVK
jgi:sterol desaturase/sphingolipid hydroxylase (fatty acid hydroxylase superfamily)